MKPTEGSFDIFVRAVQAVGDLFEDAFIKFDSYSQAQAHMAYFEIERMPVGQKASAFHRHFLPMRKELISLLAESYRRFFKLALAHASALGTSADMWTQVQFQPALRPALEWIREWYILACDGENQQLRRIGSMPFLPGQTVSMPIPTAVPPLPPSASWRAPVWLFQVSPLVGIGTLKNEHVPARDSEEKLGGAHTRLLLKGAKRAFLWALGGAIETFRNEEIAAAGTIRAEAFTAPKRGPNKRKGWEQRLKLFETIKNILSAKPDLEGMEFCAALDKRHARPLLDWIENGEWREGLTWKEAWGDPGLRRKIRRVRQEAQKAN